MRHHPAEAIASPPPLSLARENSYGKAVESWQADMERRGAREASIRQFVKRVRAVAAACDWRAPTDIRYDQASEWLARERKERGWSGTTTDGYVSAMRCFSRFCHAAGLVTIDPLLALNRSGEQGGPGDRALTVDEMRSLITIAASATARDRRARCPRGLYYGFLALTGLRTIEAGKCTWGDVDLDGDPPAIYSDPRWAKNGKRQRVCLCPEIVERLKEWRQCVPAGRTDPVFPETPNRATWIKDRVAAEIPEVDARGRRCGLHSARKFFATVLYQTGASDATISRLLRHESSITQARYIDPDPVLEVAAVKNLPRIFPPQVPLFPRLRGKLLGDGNKPSCKGEKLPIRFPSDNVQQANRPEENRPPVLTDVVADRGSPPGGRFSSDQKTAREGSAARRESSSKGPRDLEHGRFHDLPLTKMGRVVSENDPVLIFAEAVQTLGRLLERRRCESGTDEDDD